jgi:predicted glycoside hydrolase/deacetylase ChbG (UPF0249 family)
MTAKRLIVNADDFGLSAGVNEGIAAAHEQGILTSASLMVRWPEASAAAAYAQVHPELSIGLHLDLGEWTFDQGEWRVAYEVVPLTDEAAVTEEIERQLHQFRTLMGKEPTHMDSHQHVHQSEPVRSLCLRSAKELNIVLRNAQTEVRYSGDFYGQSDKGYPFPAGISVAALIRVISNLTEGTTELGCHPARRSDMTGMYREERLIECQTLCDPAVRRALQEHRVELCSFNSVRS